MYFIVNKILFLILIDFRFILLFLDFGIYMENFSCLVIYLFYVVVDCIF